MVNAVVPVGAKYVGVVWELPSAVDPDGGIPGFEGDNIPMPGLGTVKFSRRTWSDPATAPATHPETAYFDGAGGTELTTPFGNRVLVPRSCDDELWLRATMLGAQARATSLGLDFNADADKVRRASEESNCWVGPGSVFLP
jgi:hypothetical protein